MLSIFDFLSCALRGSQEGNQNNSRSCPTLGVPGRAGGFLDAYQIRHMPASGMPHELFAIADLFAAGLHAGRLSPPDPERA